MRAALAIRHPHRNTRNERMVGGRVAAGEVGAGEGL